jgi:hypothetical protein
VHSMRAMCHVSHVQERGAYETRVHSMRAMCHVSHVHRVCMQACSADALRETSLVINTNLQQQLHAIDVLTTDQYLPRMSAECQHRS